MMNKEIRISVEEIVSKYEDSNIDTHISVKGSTLSRYPSPNFTVTDDPMSIVNNFDHTPITNNGSAGILFGSLDSNEVDLTTKKEIMRAGM